MPRSNSNLGGHRVAFPLTALAPLPRESALLQDPPPDFPRPYLLFALVPGMVLVLLVLSSLACSGSAPPGGTEPPAATQSLVPTLEPTAAAHTPVPTSATNTPVPTSATNTPVPTAAIHNQAPTRTPILPPTATSRPVREYVAPTVPAIRMAPATRVLVYSPPPTVAPPPTLMVITLPTLELPPLPTLAPPQVVFTLPTPRPPAAPTPPRSAAVVTTEVAEFALKCADIKNRDESAPGWTFEGWIEEAQATGAPKILAGWWSGYVDQFALQVVHDGPSKHSQAAADDAMWELYEMDPWLREYLLDMGCLTGAEVWRADATVEALDRLVSGWGQGGNVSVEEFAEACSDIKLTAPTFGPLAAMPDHMAYWWGELTPPPELADYYDAVSTFYEKWVESGGGDPQTSVDFGIQMAVLETAQALDGDVLETLLARRCAG